MINNNQKYLNYVIFLLKKKCHILVLLIELMLIYLTLINLKDK